MIIKIFFNNVRYEQPEQLQVHDKISGNPYSRRYQDHEARKYAGNAVRAETEAREHPAPYHRPLQRQPSREIYENRCRTVGNRHERNPQGFTGLDQGTRKPPIFIDRKRNGCQPALS